MVTLGGVIIDVLDFRENVLAKSFKSDCVKLSQDLPIWFLISRNMALFPNMQTFHIIISIRAKL